MSPDPGLTALSENLTAQLKAAGIYAEPGLGGSVVIYADDLTAGKFLAALDQENPAGPHEHKPLTGNVRDSVPVRADVPYEISGPMGRAWLLLPCGHHWAWAPDPVTHTRPVTRTCRRCRTRYEITIGTGTAQVTRLN